MVLFMFPRTTPAYLKKFWRMKGRIVHLRSDTALELKCLENIKIGFMQNKPSIIVSPMNSTGAGSKTQGPR